LNQFIAKATGMSRRAADTVIAHQRVKVNNQPAQIGQQLYIDDQVTLDGIAVTLSEVFTTIMLNKPVGYVCSRDGQGSKTIYDLLPSGLHELKPVGRLDKDSSGLLLLTNDGKLAHELTHPSFQKTKVYEIELDHELNTSDKAAIERGIELEDGPSRLELEGNGKKWIVTMHEGRNRQIRRTFQTLDYNVVVLHRVTFGPYKLPASLKPGSYREL
jgi:23S rRNA pseudouridine2605 synthase